MEVIFYETTVFIEGVCKLKAEGPAKATYRRIWNSKHYLSTIIKGEPDHLSTIIKEKLKEAKDHE